MSTVETLKRDIENTEQRLLSELRTMRQGSRSKGSAKPNGDLTMGQKIADQVAAMMGSWPFIIGQ